MEHFSRRALHQPHFFHTVEIIFPHRGKLAQTRQIPIESIPRLPYHATTMKLKFDYLRDSYRSRLAAAAPRPKGPFVAKENAGQLLQATLPSGDRV